MPEHSLQNTVHFQEFSTIPSKEAEESTTIKNSINGPPIKYKITKAIPIHGPTILNGLYDFLAILVYFICPRYEIF